MSGQRLRHVVTTITGVSVAAIALWWLASAANAWGSDDKRASLADLPLGWWVVFGGIAVAVGCGAAAIVHAALRRPPQR